MSKYVEIDKRSVFWNISLYLILLLLIMCFCPIEWFYCGREYSMVERPKSCWYWRYDRCSELGGSYKNDDLSGFDFVAIDYVLLPD